MQTTDVRLFDIKVGDVLSIFLMGAFFFSFRGKINRFYFYMFGVFTIALMTSIVSLFLIKIYVIPGDTSLLKSPGLLSISRYIQICGCLFFAFYIRQYLIKNPLKNQLSILQSMDRWMLSWTIIFILFWIAGLAGIDNIFVYGNHRLKGLFAEGGPYGLFVCFYVLIRYVVIGWSWSWIALLAITIVASQSKASLIFLALGFMIIGLISNPKIFLRNFAFIAIALACMFAVGDKVFNLGNKFVGYYSDTLNSDDALKGREDDKSLIQGRIAAMHIAPRMFMDHPVIGVGLGNYSLARNNPDYLGNFPPATAWDLSGLGGLVNYLLESGAEGLIIFLWPLAILYRKSISQNRYLLAIFLLALLCGVQLYFQYIWLAIAFATSLNASNYKKISSLSPARGSAQKIGFSAQ